MQLTEFLNKVSSTPQHINFEDTISVIDAHYHFTPTAFRNGDFHNDVGQNSGSCKIFSFAKLQSLTPEQTLNCFGDYYRIEVLQHPHQQNHLNIRNFIRYGWEGIAFLDAALTQRTT